MSMPGRNTCDCQDPPGGSVTCSAGQVAICRIVNGKPITECIDPPNSPAFNPQLTSVPLQRQDIAWLVETVTGTRQEEIPSLEDIFMLLSGRNEDPEHNYVATFNFPDHIRRKLQHAGGRSQMGGPTSILPPDNPSGLAGSPPPIATIR
jgi:hypothetical protein